MILVVGDVLRNMLYHSIGVKANRQVAPGLISAFVDAIIQAVILLKGEQQHLKSPVRLTKHYTV